MHQLYGKKEHDTYNEGQENVLVAFSFGIIESICPTPEFLGACNNTQKWIM